MRLAESRDLCPFFFFGLSDGRAEPVRSSSDIGSHKPSFLLSLLGVVSTEQGPEQLNTVSLNGGVRTNAFFSK